MGEAMPEHVMLAVAELDEPGGGGELVAGALNLAGSHALVGRNWGCRHGRNYKFLHFELCYYQV